MSEQIKDLFNATSRSDNINLTKWPRSLDKIDSIFKPALSKHLRE